MLNLKGQINIMQKIISNTRIKVPFCDLDPMHIVWHGNYLKYIELARSELFEKINYSYQQMYEDNIVYPIAKMDLKYISSAKLHDVLNVKCILQEIEPAIIIKYEITNLKTGETLFKASSMQICVDARTNETLYYAPEKLRQNFQEESK